MSVSRTFRGYFHRRENLNKGLGSHRRPVLIVELTTDEAGALDAAIAKEPVRGKGIPITFVLGDTAEVVASIRDELAPAISPSKNALLEPTPFEGEVLDLLRAIRDAAISIDGHTRRVADNTQRIIGK